MITDRTETVRVEARDAAVESPDRRTEPPLPARREPARPRTWRGARRALFAAAVLGLLAVAGYLALRPSTAEVIAATRRDVETTAHGVGTVEAKTVVDLSPKISGRLLGVLVDEGDPVVRGQVLASVDDAELRAELERSEAALSRARLAVTVQGAGVGRARSALAASESAVARARAASALAAKNAERWRRLHEEGVVSEADHDARETEAALGAETLAVATAESAAVRREVDAAAAGLEMARHDVDAAEAALEAARARLGDTVMVAPLDGYVVRRLLEPGALVTPGAPVLRVADPTTAWVTIYLNESEAGSVAAGDAAEIVLRSAAARPVAGRVARVRRESDRVTEQLAVDVVFDEPPARLVLGEQAEATISGPRRSGVLAVARSSVVRSDDGPSVLVVSDGRLAVVPVRLGLDGAGGLVEVVSGLAEGQLVVSAPGRLAEPGNEGRRIRPVLLGAAPDRERSP